MASLKYTNLAGGALASGYMAGDSSLVLHTGDGASFPSSGDFWVGLIDTPGAQPNFYLKCTSRSGDTLTCETTGAEGTTAANQASGTIVRMLLTAAALDQFRSDISGIGAIASRPASGAKSGDRYRCTDSPFEYIWDGSVWQAFFAGYNVTEPVLGNLTQINCGHSTFDTTHGGILQEVSASGGNADVQAMAVAIPGSGAYYVDAAFTLYQHGTNIGWGCGLSDGTNAGSSKMVSIRFGSDNGGNWVVTQQAYNTSTSYNGTRANPTIAAVGPLIWTRIYDDRTTNRTYYVSCNGYIWHQVYQEARTTFLTPTHALIACWPYQTQVGQVHWVHFSVHA